MPLLKRHTPTHSLTPSHTIALHPTSQSKKPQTSWPRREHHLTVPPSPLELQRHQRLPIKRLNDSPKDKSPSPPFHCFSIIPNDENQPCFNLIQDEKFFQPLMLFFWLFILFFNKTTQSGPPCKAERAWSSCAFNTPTAGLSSEGPVQVLMGRVKRDGDF